MSIVSPKNVMVEVFSIAGTSVASFRNNTASGSSIIVEVEEGKNGGLNTFAFTVPVTTEEVLFNDMECRISIDGVHWFTGYAEYIPEPDTDEPLLVISGKGYVHKLKEKTVNKSYTSLKLQYIIADIASKELGIDINVYYNSNKITVPDIDDITIEFNDKDLKEVFKTLNEIANKDYLTTQYVWGVDKDKELYFSEVDTIVKEHWFEGYQYQKPKVDKLSSKLINKVLTYRTTLADSKETEFVNTYEDANSQGLYGLFEQKITFPDFVDTTTISNIANGLLESYSTPLDQVEIEDIELTGKLDIGFYGLSNKRKSYFLTVNEMEDITDWNVSTLINTVASISGDQVFSGRKSLKLVTSPGASGDYMEFELPDPIHFPNIFRVFIYFEGPNGDITIRLFDVNNNTLDVDFKAVGIEDAVGIYKSDEGQGVGGAIASYNFNGNALDLSGSGNHGVISNSPIYVAGKVGKSIQFNGTDQYATFNQVAIGTQDFWFSFWFRPDLSTRLDGVCGSGNAQDASGNGWAINYRGDTSGKAFRTYFDDGSVTGIYENTNDLGDLTDSFHHVIFNYDRTGNLTVYLDTVLVGTIDISTHQGSLTDLDFRIGRIGDHPTYYDGAIDEFNMGVGRILSLGEIAELYNNPENTNLNQPTIPDDPVGEWDLNGDSKDKSGNGNDGTDTSISYVQGRRDNDAAEFNAVTDNINLGNITLSGDMSFVGSFKVTGGAGTIRVLALKDLSFQLDIHSTNILRIFIGTGAAIAAETTSFTPVIDQWYDYALVVTANYVDLYIDGVNEYSSATTYLLGTNTNNFYYGYTSVSFIGLQEKNKIFDYALTEQQILALAEKTNPVPDYSGYENDGYSIGQLSYVDSDIGRAGQFYPGLRVPFPEQTFLASEAWSVSVWVKETVVNASSAFFMGQHGTFFNSLALNAGSVTYRNSNGDYLNSGIAITRTDLNHIVFTYNNGTWKSYVNGVAGASGVSSYSSTWNTLNDAYTGTLQLTGLLAIPRLYDREIDITEVLDLYNNPQPKNNEWIKSLTTTPINPSTGFMAVDVDGSTEGDLIVDFDSSNSSNLIVDPLADAGIVDLVKVRVIMNNNNGSVVYIDTLSAETNSYFYRKIMLERIRYKFDKAYTASVVFGEKVDSLIDEINNSVKDGDTALAVFSKQ